MTASLRSRDNKGEETDDDDEGEVDLKMPFVITFGTRKNRARMGLGERGRLGEHSRY